jgi:hypothetical protein
MLAILHVVSVQEACMFCSVSWSSHHSLPVTATVVKAGALQATLPKLSSVTCAKTGLTVALRRDLLEVGSDV